MSVTPDSRPARYQTGPVEIETERRIIHPQIIIASENYDLSKSIIDLCPDFEHRRCVQLSDVNFGKLK